MPLFHNTSSRRHDEFIKHKETLPFYSVCKPFSTSRWRGRLSMLVSLIAQGRLEKDAVAYTVYLAFSLYRELAGKEIGTATDTVGSDGIYPLLLSSTPHFIHLSFVKHFNFQPPLILCHHIRTCSRVAFPIQQIPGNSSPWAKLVETSMPHGVNLHKSATCAVYIARIALSV
jgi:hypothetical protein